MIKPILACDAPYKTAEEFVAAGWNLDFSQPPESRDPLVGVSLLDNEVLLGVTTGYVGKEEKTYIGCLLCASPHQTHLAIYLFAYLPRINQELEWPSLAIPALSP